MGRLRFRMFALAICALTALGFAGASAADRSAPASAAVYDTLVHAGGQGLHFRVAPGRLPAIVLEAGGGADASQWSDLIPRLAAATSCAVVAYDRAGFGSSESATTPYEVRSELAALHAGLERLRLASRVVYVGHSYGGLLAGIYAHQYPASVRGLVLVDPNNVGFVDAVGGASSPVLAVSFDTTRALSKVEQAGKRQVDAFSRTIEIARRSPPPKQLPIIVITAGEPSWPTDSLRLAWRESHAALVHAGYHRQLVVAEGSGHQIPATRPDLIVAAVRELLASKPPAR